jgi:hypothetical protein
MKTTVKTVARGLLWSAGALLLVQLGSATAAADRVVNANEPIIISNDITERTTDVESASDVPVDFGGQDNNGHGNNDDGVDSSNLGQGNGGPNGDTDASCDGSGTCVDDESSGGGASPSNGNGNSKEK